ncbi:hypothetical protein M0804_003864 [Polistes exclamans]|nr:hypothetical protein M0804_003864 [Polistes exclamans]
MTSWQHRKRGQWFEQFEQQQPKQSNRGVALLSGHGLPQQRQQRAALATPRLFGHRSVMQNQPPVPPKYCPFIRQIPNNPDTQTPLT